VKVNLTLVAGNYSQYAAEIFTEKYQSTLTPLMLGGLYFVATQVLDKTQTNNVFGSSDEQVNRLLADIAAAVPGSARQTGYLEQLNQRLNELAWFVPVAVTYSMQAVDTEPVPRGSGAVDIRGRQAPPECPPAARAVRHVRRSDGLRLIMTATR
jgi:hypothetical protein